jgi:hypothetical protein
LGVGDAPRRSRTFREEISRCAATVAGVEKPDVAGVNIDLKEGVEEKL